MCLPVKHEETGRRQVYPAAFLNGLISCESLVWTGLKARLAKIMPIQILPRNMNKQLILPVKSTEIHGDSYFHGKNRTTTHSNLFVNQMMFSLTNRWKRKCERRLYSLYVLSLDKSKCVYLLLWIFPPAWHRESSTRMALAEGTTRWWPGARSPASSCKIDSSANQAPRLCTFLQARRWV